MYDRVKITKAEYIALTALQKDAEAHQAFMQQMMDVGRDKQRKLQEAAKKTWLALAKAHNLDLEKVVYVPGDDPDNPEIIPTTVMLQPPVR